MKCPRPSLRTLACTVVLLLLGAHVCVAQSKRLPDTRPILTTSSPIVDMAQQPSGRVWVCTRTFEVFTAMPGDPSWTLADIEFAGLRGKLEIRQVARLLFLTDEIGLLAGDVRTYEGDVARSCILRTTNGGRAWSPVTFSDDTLGVTDALRATSDGMLFQLDRSGRYWTSNDKGASWVLGKMPKTLVANSIKEMDMTTSKMGVAVDGERTIHFTTNAWQSVIPGRPSPRPIVRTQPTFLDQLAWARDLVLWNDRMLLVEGRDIYRTMLNDLLWERWDSVAQVCISDDRKFLYALYVNGELWQWKSGEAQPTKVADGIVAPRFMRAAHGNVLLYRLDTGPILITPNGVTTMRLYAASGEIREPRRTIKTKDTEWGIDWQEPTDLAIDIYRRVLPKGQWQRDTFLYAGKTLFRVIGKDSLLFAEGSSAQLYDAKTRQLQRYTLTRPIESFFASPVAGFRVVIERSTGQTTRRQWVDYRGKGATLSCAELVDSSKSGIQSSAFVRDVPRADVMSLLTACNTDGNAYPNVRDVAITDADHAQFRAMLDTIFRYDGYFDTLDLYRPPPATDAQIATCRQDFLRYVAELGTLSSERFGKAMLDFRHWPTDRDVRYMIEFVNVAGDVLSMEIDRSNEVHLPRLMPWRITYRGQQWHWYGQQAAPFWLAAFPPTAVPTILTRMMQPEWLLLAVASSIDAERTGRVHRWYARPWKP